MKHTRFGKEDQLNQQWNLSNLQPIDIWGSAVCNLRLDSINID